ncbi:MAG: PQQ-binding-like beta-propeller repeat protein [Sphingomonadaceae bacterium]|nr:PQQ-binding-like beta-propeller repeat protein [Sphingomonadaceae bacterium]
MNKTFGAIGVMLALTGCGLFGDDDETPTVGNRTPVLVSETPIVADPQIANVPVVLPMAATNASWAQPGGSADKSVGHLGLGAAPTRVWSVSIGNGGSNRKRIASPPVIAGGRVYTMDADAVIRAFDAATGSMAWEAQLGSDIGSEVALFGGGVSVEGDRLYATNGVGYAAALNAADGSVIWKVRPGPPLRGAPTIASGTVYVVSQDNQLFALDPADGSTNWNAAGALEVSGVFGVAAPAAAQGTVVAGFSSGELSAFRYENGRALWQDSISRTSISTSVSSLSDIDASPVIEGGIVYAIGQGGRMIALQLATGQRIWELNVGGIATPWVAGDWLFAVTDEAKVIAVARASGRIRWMTQLNRWRDVEDRRGPIYWRGPVLAGGRLILVSTRGELAFLDAATGAVQQIVEAGEGFDLNPVVANDTLYLLDNSGQLSAWR